MRVLVVNSLSAHYGSTVRARLIYRALNDIGVKASYVESNSDLKSPGVISISQRNNIFSYFMASLRRAWLCWRGDYEVYIIQKITPLTIFAIFSVMLRRRRLIVDWDDLDSQFQANNFRKLLVSFIEKKLPRYLQQITVHNRYLADYAAALGAQNITIIPQCIDTETFDPSKYDVDGLKASKGLAGKIVLTYLCTFTEGGTCDLDIVLEAVAEAIKKNPSLYLLLVGGGPLEYKYRRRLHELAISEGAITGFLSGRQVAEYLAMSDICLVYMRG